MPSKKETTRSSQVVSIYLSTFGRETLVGFRTVRRFGGAGRFCVNSRLSTNSCFGVFAAFAVLTFAASSVLTFTAFALGSYGDHLPFAAFSFVAFTAGSGSSYSLTALTAGTLGSYSLATLTAGTLGCYSLATLTAGSLGCYSLAALTAGTLRSDGFAAGNAATVLVTACTTTGAARADTGFHAASTIDTARTTFTGRLGLQAGRRDGWTS